MLKSQRTACQKASYSSMRSGLYLCSSSLWCRCVVGRRSHAASGASGSRSGLIVSGARMAGAISTASSLRQPHLSRATSGRAASNAGVALRAHARSLWTPSSQAIPANEGVVVARDLNLPVVAGRGPAPPSPILQERFQSVISQLFMQRIIRLGGAVDDDMANLIVAQLLYLDSEDPKRDVTLYINSPGGSVTAGMAVFDTMRHVRPDVSTVCVGLAASMGAFLLASGQKSKRYSLPNSRIMIHQPLGGAQGQAADIEIQANEILHHKLTLNGYLAEFTGQPMEQITVDTDRDFFMSAQEAVEYGLIDAVVTSPHVAMQTP